MSIIKIRPLVPLPLCKNKHVLSQRDSLFEFPLIVKILDPPVQLGRRTILSCSGVLKARLRQGSRTQVPRATIVRSQFARRLRSSDGYTISFRNGSIAAM